MESWNEFIDKVYDYCQADRSYRARRVPGVGANHEERERLRKELEADLVSKMRELDKVFVKLELAFRGSEHEENLQAAYELFGRIRSGEAELGEIMDFGRSIAATLRRSPQEAA